MNFTFNLGYFVSTIVLFIIEVLIALYAHDQFIRPVVGDVIVVILIYAFIKAFVNTPVVKTAIAVLLFSYAVEFSQYLQLVKILGLSESKLANIVMGNYFSWVDMLAYTIGFCIVLVVERKKIV